MPGDITSLIDELYIKPYNRENAGLAKHLLDDLCSEESQCFDNYTARKNFLADYLKAYNFYIAVKNLESRNFERISRESAESLLKNGFVYHSELKELDSMFEKYDFLKRDMVKKGHELSILREKHSSLIHTLFSSRKVLSEEEDKIKNAEALFNESFLDYSHIIEELKNKYNLETTTETPFIYDDAKCRMIPDCRIPDYLKNIKVLYMPFALFCGGRPEIKKPFWVTREERIAWQKQAEALDEWRKNGPYEGFSEGYEDPAERMDRYLRHH